MEDRLQVYNSITHNRSAYDVYFPRIRINGIASARSVHMSCHLDTEDNTHLISWYIRDRSDRMVMILSGIMDQQGEWNGFVLTEKREGVEQTSYINGDNAEVLSGFIALPDAILEHCANSRIRENKSLHELFTLGLG